MTYALEHRGRPHPANRPGHLPEGHQGPFGRRLGARCQEHLDRPPRWVMAWHGDPYCADQRPGAARCGGARIGWDDMRGVQGLRLDVDPKVALAPAAVRSALGLVETWDTAAFKAPEPVAAPVSHGSQMGDYLLFLVLIASRAGASFGLARILDAPTPALWLFVIYYGMFGQTFLHLGLASREGLPGCRMFAPAHLTGLMLYRRLRMTRDAGGLGSVKSNTEACKRL